MNYEHNHFSGYRKCYLNSPKGYSRKMINAQTGHTNDKKNNFKNDTW